MASLTDENLVSARPREGVGFLNYLTEVFTADFVSALMVTVGVIVLSVVIQLPIGLGLALLLVRPLMGKAALRTFITLPMMLTPMAVGLMWRFLVDPDLGAIRWFASLVDETWQPNILGNPVGALGLIVTVNSWINIPFVTLLMLAALLGVPGDLYEAAAIDGAGWWRTLLKITVPSIAPVLAVCAALRVAADFRMFDLVFTITRGGPGSSTVNLSMLAYQESMVNFQIGRACAIAVAMAVIAMPFYWFFNRMMRE
ncbi:carbohydrate ABC transporter permease [Microbacterium lushaniae]|uniref:Sugar ABC transporter permease n=1 Tax=Microbacterium lushaniae TaxID=2614639 RepID=A0A5J6L719_9MICO|nr:sugar ABC transporter permease [Microbacterium lushaniae]QEW04323.1 sugar ABC transporter permease [Microbacterium lushaniae]